MKTAFLITAWVAALGLAFSGPALAGKRKRTTTATTTAYTSGAATLDHPGRLLASNCFQCHGTNGHGMESLAGQSASEISGELYEMQRETIGTDIMHVYAQGFTDAQIGLIADYFSKQQR
jgi:sulfide dehydrogenase cytochrome subunit